MVVSRSSLLIAKPHSQPLRLGYVRLGWVRLSIRFPKFEGFEYGRIGPDNFTLVFSPRIYIYHAVLNLVQLLQESHLFTMHSVRHKSYEIFGYTDMNIYYYEETRCAY